MFWTNNAYATQAAAKHEMQKQLRKPANWQDFETLCKKLWGEIWQVPHEIKKNGRTGQVQAGVDVYAVPKGETEYWGIQSKGKDDYTNATLTPKEVDEEYAKALTFQPKLGCFIFATTANKDATIETYVRNLDISSRQANGPKVLLFCWEDIAELIDENRNTHDWYLKEQKFANKFDFEVSFGGGEKQLALRPTFARKYRQYVYKPVEISPPVSQSLNAILDPHGLLGLESNLTLEHSFLRPLEVVPRLRAVNSRPALVYHKIPFGLRNSGSQVIEDWKLYFELYGAVEEVVESEPPSDGFPRILIPSLTTYCNVKEISYRSYQDKPLVQGDGRSFEVFLALQAQEGKHSITVKWELVARDYSTTGELTIAVTPQYEDGYVTKVVRDPSEVRELELISTEEVYGSESS